MINKFIRYYNQNRGNIFKFIIIVASIIIFIRLANMFVKGTNKKEIDSIISNNIQSSNSTQSINNTNKENGGLISSSTKDNTTANAYVSIIDEFVTYCNEGNIEKAYELVANNCKKVLYNNDINIFKLNYYNKIFKTPKSCLIEKWENEEITSIYKVTYYNKNILSTGKIDNKNNVEDYITIIGEDEKLKINLNNFILKEDINKTRTNTDFDMEVESKIVFKDYLLYSISISNKSDKTILLNSGQDSSDICIYDENGTKYESYLHEIPLKSLEIGPKQQKSITIKFNKLLANNNKIEYIEFNNIISDKALYETNQEYQKINIKINL